MNRAMLVLILPLIVVACNEPEHWPSEPFTAEAWRASQSDQRYKLAKNLQETNALRGKGRADVVALLGKPDFESADGAYISYVVRTGGVGFNQVFALDVRFDNSQRVAELKIRGD